MTAFGRPLEGASLEGLWRRAEHLCRLIRFPVPDSLWPVVCVFILVSLAKCWYILDFPAPFVWGDSYLYASRAFHLAESGVPSIENYFGPNYPPLYSVLLAPAYLLSTEPGTAHQLMLVINILINGSLVFPVFLIGRRLGMTSGESLVASSALALLLPGVAGYTFAIMAENLFIPLLAWTIYAFRCCLERPGTRTGSAAGLVTAAAILTKSFGLVLVPLLAAVCLLAQGSRRSRLKAAISAFTALAVPLAAWALLDPGPSPKVHPFSEAYPVFSYLLQLNSVLSGSELALRFLQLAANQLAYLLLGSFLMLPPALVPPATDSHDSRTSRRFGLVLALLIAGSVTLSVLHSLVQFSYNPARYALMPRYLDPLLPLILITGIARLDRCRAWSRRSAALVVMLGLTAAVTIPCVEFGVVDRMGLAFITPMKRFLDCRTALVLLGVGTGVGVLLAVRRMPRMLLLTALIGLCSFGSWMAIRAERSLSRYHDRMAEPARWIADRIPAGSLLVLDVSRADTASSPVRSAIWRLLFQTQQFPVRVMRSELQINLDPAREVVLVDVSCLVEADSKSVPFCLWAGPFGARPEN